MESGEGGRVEDEVEEDLLSAVVGLFGLAARCRIEKGNMHTSTSRSKTFSREGHLLRSMVDMVAAVCMWAGVDEIWDCLNCMKIGK